MPLLKTYAAATGGKPLGGSLRFGQTSSLRILNTVTISGRSTGEAFGTAPAHGTLPNQQPVTGFLGNGLVNSYLNGDDTTGKLTSQSFHY